MVMEVVHEDVAGDGGMHCANHPFKNIAAPGGICAFCLQEKLGKLVSSSFPMSVFPSSSSSPSPSFRSDIDGGSAAAGGLPLRHLAASSHTDADSIEACYYPRRSSRLPFVLTHRKNKNKNKIKSKNINLANESSENSSIVFKRSKSTVTPRRGMNFLDESLDSPNKRSFWSFLYSSSSSKHSNPRKYEKDSNFTLNVGKGEEFVAVDESPDVGLGGKVSRSRSVGCGSKSFSSDFFERISTGFGDCTLRRVESQREGKSKSKIQPSVQRNNGDCIKERVRCGGIFSGFIITSSSSSSSSLVSEDNTSNNNNNNINKYSNKNGKSASVGNSLSHGRSKSWGWALASPMRAFASKQSDSGKKDSAKQVTPNLAAIPSLLAVGG
ncbi:phytochrome interacting factor 3 [Striga asiatica]|uniref:Phytochrome interacting factor 3 n=1 Tax=Striga asiatica TaxID=4170 RepID=A0A5A7PKT4_STRAF|nr:phytochrome interacting factor 3 [Striga asiatica]